MFGVVKRGSEVTGALPRIPCEKLRRREGADCQTCSGPWYLSVMTGSKSLWVGRVRHPGRVPASVYVRVYTEGGVPGPSDVVEEIPDPFALARTTEGDDVITWVTAVAPVLHGLHQPLGDLTILAPVIPPKIVCVGRNYLAHAQEMGNEVPTEPLLFFKPPTAAIGPLEPIRLPLGFERIDMEAELVVVIGRRTYRVSRDEALDCVLGYTLGNDVSCRDLQKKDQQWTRAKGFDTFAAFGPWIRVSALGETLPAGARIQGFRNDEIRQDAALKAMVFDVAFIVAYIADCMTLEPGDVIYTGTPEGVSALVPGDSVRIGTSGGLDLGSLVNPVIAR